MVDILINIAQSGTERLTRALKNARVKHRFVQTFNETSPGDRCFVLIPEPGERLLWAWYERQKSGNALPQERTTFRAWIDQHEFAIQDNEMVRRMAGLPIGNEPRGRPVNQNDFVIAAANLRECAFVGLTCEWKDSLARLRRLFGNFTYPLEVEHPGCPHFRQLHPSLLNRVNFVTRWDAMLFEEAQKIYYEVNHALYLG